MYGGCYEYSVFLLQDKEDKERIMELLTEHWEYVVIDILGIDKAVALSPSTWDDLLWTSVKKALYKAAGKEESK